MKKTKKKYNTLPRLQSIVELKGRVLNKAHNKRATHFMVCKLKMAYV